MSEPTAYPPAPEFDDVSPRELDHNGVEYWKRIANKWERMARRDHAEAIQARATISALSASIQLLTKPSRQPATRRNDHE
ncbi:hypothetical protein WM016_04770 [Bifidobacterium mongoliense]|uniref:hypothetical protein n=1 Tax=Bifidobacterium mongoliense TaxID=518643 RepID=UPI0030EB3F2D